MLKRIIFHQEAKERLVISLTLSMVKKKLKTVTYITWLCSPSMVIQSLTKNLQRMKSNGSMRQSKMRMARLTNIKQY